MEIIGSSSGNKRNGFINRLQKAMARKGGRIGRFGSQWNARSDRKMFRRNRTMGF